MWIGLRIAAMRRFFFFWTTPWEDSTRKEYETKYEDDGRANPELQNSSPSFDLMDQAQNTKQNEWALKKKCATASHS